MNLTACDIVIADLAAETVTLRERISSLEADVDAYRTVSQQTIHALHELMRERDRLREQYHRLLDEYRHVREKILRQAVAA